MILLELFLRKMFTWHIYREPLGFWQRVPVAGFFQDEEPRKKWKQGLGFVIEEFPLPPVPYEL